MSTYWVIIKIILIYSPFPLLIIVFTCIILLYYFFLLFNICPETVYRMNVYTIHTYYIRIIFNHLTFIITKYQTYCNLILIKQLYELFTLIRSDIIIIPWWCTYSVYPLYICSVLYYLEWKSQVTTIDIYNSRKIYFNTFERIVNKNIHFPKNIIPSHI